MKKILFLLCVLGCFAQPVLAGNIDLGTAGFTQDEFKFFSKDMGSALSYKAVTPTEPLGITGFDLGLEATSTAVNNSQLWADATGSSVNHLIVPKIHIYKGLPLNFDVGAFYSAVPTTNIKLYGGELRYAILEGGMVSPAVGVRAAFTKMTGVDQLDFNSKSLDVSISKGFAMFTPYAGIGQVWVDSNPKGVPLLTEYTFQQSKVFVGGNLNFGITNLDFEYDKTGSDQSYSAKIGFRF